MDVFYAWLASIASGIKPLVIKGLSRNLVKNPWTFNVLWLASLLPFTVFYALVNNAGLPHDWFSILGVGFCAAAFYGLYAVSLFKIDVSVMAPLFSFRIIFSILLGVILLGESLTILGVFLVVATVLAIPLAIYDEKLRLKAFSNRYIVVAIVSMAALALQGYFMNISFHKNGFATTLLWQDAVALLLLSPFARGAFTQKIHLTRRVVYSLLFLGFIGLVHNASVIAAYGNGLITSSIITSLPLSMLFVWIASKYRGQLLESHSTRVYVVRFAGTFLMIGCALWLGAL